ncbi:MAG TPA: BadF/BadG/BcrA/BcrD ATPase family protein [Fimbriimonas sp.]|nr:BadF/BadG/BcrA/BcrD ATPase family protein [Fimbriimonas sp.]
MSVFVGLDCGGSSSRVMAVDAMGKILYQGHSGAANLVSTPESRVRRNLTHASRGCPPPQFVCGCFAGLINDEVRTRGIEHLREVFPGAALRAEPDYTAAFYASPPGTDICVISGTGSLVCSRKDGEIVKSGGRGFILGDEGSSYQYGRDAIRHFIRDPEQCSEFLREALLEHFGSLDSSTVTAAVYRAPTPATLLSRFSRALGQDAVAGEPYALKSLEINTAELAETVFEHAHHYLDPQRTLTISLAGGLWKASPIFRERFAAALRARLDVEELVVTRIARPPLYGAVELAKEMGIGN